MARGKKTVGSKRAPNKATNMANKLGTPLPVGTKLTDMKKCEWILGPQIGQGGFGLIYTARRASDTEDRHVMKIEPEENGALFREIHFYHSVKSDKVSAWMMDKGLKSLGLPTDVSSGFHTEGPTKYRFLSLERYGQDLYKLSQKNGRRLSAVTTLAIGLKIINVLEYIHRLEYVHSDIKGPNLVVGLPPNENEVYLVDFGLALPFANHGERKEYKEDPRRRHDGTLEYCSLDSHRGVSAAPRGDFQTLAFCMLEWICGRLPWDPLLGDSNLAMERVFEKKEECMKNVQALAVSCGFTDIPDFVDFLGAIAALPYDKDIDYDAMRAYLERALCRLGADPKNLKLDFDLAQDSRGCNMDPVDGPTEEKPEIGGDVNGKSIEVSNAKITALKAPRSAPKRKSSEITSGSSSTKQVKMDPANGEGRRTLRPRPVAQLKPEKQSGKQKR